MKNLILIAAVSTVVVCASKFRHRHRDQEPELVRDGTHVYHIYDGLNGEKLKFEAIITMGMSDDQIVTAEQAIVRHYTGEVALSGAEVNVIGDDMEKLYGGYWTVGFFEDPYGMAYTVAKRAPMYVVFEVNEEKGILVASQGPPKPSEMKAFRHYARNQKTTRL